MVWQLAWSSWVGFRILHRGRECQPSGRWMGQTPAKFGKWSWQETTRKHEAVIMVGKVHSRTVCAYSWTRNHTDVSLWCVCVYLCMHACTHKVLDMEPHRRQPVVIHTRTTGWHLCGSVSSTMWVHAYIHTETYTHAPQADVCVVPYPVLCEYTHTYTQIHTHTHHRLTSVWFRIQYYVSTRTHTHRYIHTRTTGWHLCGSVSSTI